MCVYNESERSIEEKQHIHFMRVEVKEDHYIIIIIVVVIIIIIITTIFLNIVWEIDCFPFLGLDCQEYR